MNDRERQPIGSALLWALALATAAACTDVDEGLDEISPVDGGDAGGEPELLEVTFIDVGQGDAALIELPVGEVILIDGGSNGYGYSDVVPILDEKGIETIDIMVMTHPHSDHCGGLDEVMAAVDVVEIWENGETLDTSSYIEFAVARDDEGAAVLVPDQGYSRQIGTVRLAVLNREEGWEGENNDSLVILVSHGDVDFLMTGDVETEEQEDLVGDWGDLLACEVLKVPHHGSYNFHLSFVGATSPDHAVVSCGEGNPYGHPHQEALDAYLSEGAIVCRTDTSGDISAVSDGTQVEVSCANPTHPP